MWSKYRCGERGFEDSYVRLEVMRCGFLAEGLLAFRNLLFPEVLGRGWSYFVCERSQVSGMRFTAAVVRAGNGVTHGISFAGEEEAVIQRALGFVSGLEFGIWVCKIFALQAQGSSPSACRHCGQHQEEQDTQFGKQRHSLDSHRSLQSLANGYAPVAHKRSGYWMSGLYCLLIKRTQCKKSWGVHFGINGRDYFELVLISNVGGRGAIIASWIKGSNTGWQQMIRNWGAN